MMPFNRSAPPNILKDNYKRLGKNWEKRKIANPNARFNWTKGIYDIILKQ
jgi:hypothetical protein